MVIKGYHEVADWPWLSRKKKIEQEASFDFVQEKSLVLYSSEMWGIWKVQNGTG